MLGTGPVSIRYYAHHSCGSRGGLGTIQRKNEDGVITGSPQQCVDLTSHDCNVLVFEPAMVLVSRREYYDATA